ncbi:MAG: tetratricopeptide repeat protein, partial [Bacteroidota bacterium]
MKVKSLILILLFSFLAFIVSAQCPPFDSITKATITKRVSSAVTAPAKLSIMLQYYDIIVKCGFKKDSTYAWLIYKIGSHYYVYSSSTDGIKYLQEYINFYKPGINDGVVTNEGVVNSYYFLSKLYDGLNNIASRNANDSCIIISERLNDPYNAACLQCLAARTQYFYDIGEYKLCTNDAEKCENYARGFLKIVTSKDLKDFGESVINYNLHWRINALTAMKRFAEAEKLLASKVEEYNKGEPNDYLALTYAQLAPVLEAEGKYEESLADLNLALKIYKGIRKNFSCKQVLNKIGQDLYVDHYKDYDKALTCFKTALTFVNDNPALNRPDSIESLSIYGAIANIYIQKGLFDSGFNYFNLAMSFIKKGADINYILNSSQDEFSGIKKIEYLSDLLINYGNAYKRKYDAKGEAQDLTNAILFYSKVD